MDVAGDGSAGDGRKAFEIMGFPHDAIRYAVYLIIFVSSLVLINEGNALGTPLLAMIVIYVLLEAAQRIAASKMLASTEWAMPVAVTRDGKKIEVDRGNLQQGDSIRLSKGDIIPADCHVIEAKNLSVDERPAGGGSNVKKEDYSVLMENSCIISGSADAEVLGRSAAAKSQELPFSGEAKNLAGKSFTIGIAYALAIFFAGAAAGISAATMFLAAAAVMALFLSQGSSFAAAFSASRTIKKLAEKGMLFTKTGSLEKLGKASVVVADKDAFTTGAPAPTGIYVDGNIFSYEGGRFYLHNRQINPKKYRELALALACGMMANTSSLSPARKGDAEEIALLEAAESAQMDDMREQYECLHAEPFSKEKQMITAGYKIGNKAVYYARGSLDAILGISSSILAKGISKRISADDRELLRETARAMESKGNSVIALAVKRALPGKKHAEKDFMLVGLAATSNTVGKASEDAVSRLARAGVKTVLATGLDRESSLVLARDAGIKAGEDEVVTGKQIEAMSDEELYRRAAYLRVIAGATPYCKARLIQALQKMGHSVLATGSHADDMVFLNSADAPVASAHAGDFVKKQAGAEMRGGISSVAAGIEDARAFRRFASGIFSHNLLAPFAIGLVIILSAIIAGTAAISPVHVMWVAVVFSIGISLAGAGTARHSGRIMPAEYHSMVGGKRLMAVFAKSAIISIIPVLALVFADAAVAASLAVSFLIVVLLLGTIAISRGGALAGVIAGLAIHALLAQLVPGLSQLAPASWITVFAVSVIILAAIESPRLLKRAPAPVRIIRTSRMRVEHEGWKGSRAESLLRKVREAGKGGADA